MQLGFCYVKRQQIPLKRFLCLRKGGGSGGSTGTEPASQPRSGEGSPEPSGPTPPAAPSQKPSLPAGRGRPGGCGTGEGRRRFPTGAISHSGGPHLPGRRRQRERKVGASLRSISNELGKCWGRGGIRLRPPTAHLPRQARDCPGHLQTRPCAHRGAGRLQGRLRGRAGRPAGRGDKRASEAAQLGWQHFLSPRSRKWGSRHILYSSEAALSQAEPNPAPHVHRADQTPASRGPQAWQVAAVPGVTGPARALGAKPARASLALPTQPPCPTAPQNSLGRLARPPGHQPQTTQHASWDCCAATAHPGRARARKQGARRNTGHVSGPLEAWGPLWHSGRAPSPCEREEGPSSCRAVPEPGQQ